MVDCGLRLIAALTGLGWIADRTLGTLQCKDASCGVALVAWPNQNTPEFSKEAYLHEPLLLH
eukprot:4412758-Alexandrium_andersonii.AAC.1